MTREYTNLSENHSPPTKTTEAKPRESIDRNYSKLKIRKEFESLKAKTT
jgi:hypothetical protein